MIIKLKALDTLFFRDGKPFTMGEDTWASGIFPPAPSVFYGSLRSAYIAQNLNQYSVRELIAKTEKLKIKHISFEVYAKIMDSKKSEKGQYFPLPKDLVAQKKVSDEEEYQRKEENIHKTYKLQLSKKSLALSSNQTPLFLQSPFEGEEVKEVDNGIIHSLAFRKYLQGRDEDFFEGRELDKFLSNEPKVGIGRDDITHTTTEGLLYRVGMRRPKEVQIIIDFEEIEGLSLASSGFLKVGGEGKSVAYQLSKSLDITFKMTKLADDEATFKLYLATPALFKNGWQPSQIFETAGVDVELMAAALGKPVNIGGFDMDKKRPKPMLRAVPAGSVYYYQLKSGSLQNLFNAIKEHRVSEERAEEGFGIAYLAKI